MSAPHASMTLLLRYLARFAPIPPDELGAFAAAHAEEVVYPRGQFFTRSADQHDRLGFVISGLFRVYYTGIDGAYHVRNFCREGAPIGSYATVLSGQPAHVDIEALEESTVVQFSYRALKDQYDKSAVWERLGRRVAEEHYISRERRERVLLTLDAAGRLEQFDAEFPGLDERLTGADIASYIGVRPETLSRLRARRRG